MELFIYLSFIAERLIERQFLQYKTTAAIFFITFIINISHLPKYTLWKKKIEYLFSNNIYLSSNYLCKWQL